MVETLICTHTETRPVYKNWVEHTKDYRLNIIQNDLNGGPLYCLALTAIEDPVAEGGIPVNENLSKRVQKVVGLENLSCSHIEILNLLRTRKL